MKSCFNSLCMVNLYHFLVEGVWGIFGSLKVIFIAWEMAWVKILTLDNLRRGLF